MQAEYRPSSKVKHLPKTQGSLSPYPLKVWMMRLIGCSVSVSVWQKIQPSLYQNLGRNKKRVMKDSQNGCRG